MTPNTLTDLAAGVPVQNWMILGPFVIKTPGHFEREYLYERERILDVDYLAADGGEASVAPELGKAHDNIGIGSKQLEWRRHPRPDLYGTHIAKGLLYETVQRNCVIYAAAFIDAHHPCTALLDAQHSGMKAWVNGELVCNEPYGLPKGVRLTAPSKTIALKGGRNLLLVKFRVGYISDGVQFEVRNVQVSPLVSERGLPMAMGRVRALPLFTGTVDQPRQIIEAVLVNPSHVDDKVSVSVSSDVLKDQDSQEIVVEAGKTVPVRLTLATPPGTGGMTVDAVVRARLYGRELEAAIEYEALEPPKRDGTTMVLSAFHFDTTYHEEQRVYAMGAFDIVRQYCRLHREDPNFRSTISELDYLKPYLDMFPEDRETLFAAFREGRANSDCMYNQPNEQNCGDEGLVRNFVYGQLFTGGVLGNPCHCYSPGDVFGHPNQLSQIVRKSGCMGVMWDKHIFNFPPFFTHLALDGEGLPHKRGEANWEEATAMGLSLVPGSIDQTPPTDWHADLLPKAQQATHRDLMEAIEQQTAEAGAHLPVTSRDMALYHAATAMSRINLKIANRLGENLLLDAEKYATIASLLGAVYPEKALDKAWRQILCGQHHDSITGTHNEISYVDLINSYREVLELGGDVLDRSLDFLGRAIDPEDAAQPLVVFNALAWERTDVVRATVKPGGGKGFAIQEQSGKNVPFEVLRVGRDRKGRVTEADIAFVGRKLPSLGYRVYDLVPSEKPLPERKRRDDTVIENEFYRIEVDPARGGGIVSLYDKKAKREVLNKKAGHVGNELAVLQEVPDREETQHEFYTTGLKMFSGDIPAVVEVEKGAISATLRVRYDMGEMGAAVQEITLTKGVKRIDFRTILDDYQGEDQLFCVTFPVDVAGATPVFDERFGTVVRNDSRNYMDFRTHRQIMFSDCAVYAANKWMEYGASATLRMGRNAYALGMVGLITPKAKTDVAVAEDLMRVLIKKGVTCTPWFDKDGPHWGSYQDDMADDLLYTRFRIALGSRGRNAYSKKLLAAQSAMERKAFEKRLKENGHACLFVMDTGPADLAWPAMPVLIIEGESAEALAEGLDAMLAGFPTTATIKLPAEVDATGERHTVDDYGVAILNQGTYANSIEKGGTICMMLAHTCRWYGGTNNFPEGYLVPENKNHVFHYALYPHAGDWCAADTHKAAHAFNSPLRARQTKPAKKPCLPAEMAFVEVDPKNVLLTAMKPFGNPLAAMKRDAQNGPGEGVMVRVYDTEGRDAQAHVTFAAGMRSAWSANLLEEREFELPVHGNGLSMYVGPYSIETAGFVPGKLGRKMGNRTLGAEAEPVQPVWVRSWEHDAESMPMGYHAVVCSISREVFEEDGGKTLVLKVNAVNDCVDAQAKGTAELTIPSGWQTDSARVAFDLAPLGHQVTEVRVTRPSTEAAGQLKLRYEYDGQTFQDVLEIGGAFEVHMEVENRVDAIVVRVSNPTAETVEGEVSMVTPLETWSREVSGDYALMNISPRTQGFSLPGEEEVELVFAVTPEVGRDLVRHDSYWAVAKLMSNGRIKLKRCGALPERRVLSDRKWFDAQRAREQARRRKK
jgi:alpha-mannosidase